MSILYSNHSGTDHLREYMYITVTVITLNGKRSMKMLIKYRWLIVNGDIVILLSLENTYNIIEEKSEKH